MVHDSLQACRAVSILAAVTGNIGIPGGNVTVSQRGETSQNSHAFIGYDLLPADKIPLRRGFDEFPLLCDKLSPVPTAHMPTLWETIATDKPYPVKAALIFGSNALISYSNTPRVEEAMRKLEFIAVCDLFMTPTAQMADIVLPASSWLETGQPDLILPGLPDLHHCPAEGRGSGRGAFRCGYRLRSRQETRPGGTFLERFGGTLRLPHRTHGIDIQGIQGEKTDLCTARLPAVRKKRLQDPFGKSGTLLFAPRKEPLRSPAHLHGAL